MQTYSLLGIFLWSFYFVEKVVRHFAQIVAAIVLYPDKSIGYFFCYLILKVYGCDDRMTFPAEYKACEPFQKDITSSTREVVTGEVTFPRCNNPSETLQQFEMHTRKTISSYFDLIGVIFSLESRSTSFTITGNHNIISPFPLLAHA